MTIHSLHVDKFIDQLHAGAPSQPLSPFCSPLLQPPFSFLQKTPLQKTPEIILDSLIICKSFYCTPLQKKICRKTPRSVFSLRVNPFAHSLRASLDALAASDPSVTREAQ